MDQPFLGPQSQRRRKAKKMDHQITARKSCDNSMSMHCILFKCLRFLYQNSHEELCVMYSDYDHCNLQSLKKVITSNNEGFVLPYNFCQDNPTSEAVSFTYLCILYVTLAITLLQTGDCKNYTQLDYPSNALST
jgi:hypothetical protein